MENLFSIFWRGLAIGILVSAPMGPVGILCIQRTLDRGRKTGLYTGIGASASDFIYCLLTGLGLAFIEDFLERNRDVIQLVGSAVLIGFAIYLFRKNPTAGLRRPDGGGGSPTKNILGGFLFTFSNPLILFLIIGLFARFNFLSADYKFYHYILGYISIVVGALGWWYLVTYLVDKLRAHFNVRSMWLINRVIGVVILIFAVVGIISASSSLVNGAERAPALSVPIPRPLADTLEVPMSLPALRTAQLRVGYPSGGISLVRKPVGAWSLSLRDTAGRGLRLEVAGMKTDYSDPLYAGRDALTIRLRDLPSGVLLVDTTADRGLSTRTLPNLWSISRHDDNIWVLEVGDKSPELNFPFRFEDFNVDTLTLAPEAGRELLADMLILRGANVRRFCQSASQTDGETSETLFPLAGRWRMIDRQMQSSNVDAGGDYLLRLRPVVDGYEIEYLEGAKIYPGSWLPGHLKALMTATGVAGVYDLEWLKADGSSADKEARAVYSPDDNLLSFIFPHLQATMRFARLEESLSE